MTTFAEQVQAAGEARLAELQEYLVEADHIRRTIATAKGEPAPVSLMEAQQQIQALRDELEHVKGANEKLDKLAHDLQEDKQTIARERREARTELTAATKRIEELESALAKAAVAADREEDDGKSKRESEDKAPETPERKSDQESGAAKPAAPGGNGRVTLSAAKVRDVIFAHYEPDQQIPMQELADRLGCNRTTLLPYVKELVSHGTVRRTGGERGPGVKFFRAPKPEGGGPTSRPKSAPPHVGGTDVPKGRGQTVSGTGKPAGPASTPGKFRAQQRKAKAGGKRVKAKRVGGVRV